MAILVAALCLLAAAVLVAGHLLEQRRRGRRIADRLQGQMTSTDKFGSLIRQLGSSSLAQRSVSLDNETQVLLNRVGWRKASQRSLFAAFQVGVPVLLMGLTILGQRIFFPEVDPAWIAPIAALGIGYLLPKRVLAAAAKHRQQSIAKEISTFIPLLRILFESGMAVEQSLRVLGNEAQCLLPHLTHELRLILARVDSGLELGE